MRDEAYLGVAHSVLGRRWQDRLNDHSAREAQSIAAAHGVSEVLARVIASRGADVHSASAFLAPRLRDAMPDPSVLIDMDKAVARLEQAIEARESVAIFGDYDVDGACSAALLGEYLRHFGLQPIIHIPDRLTEGYGPNIEAITALRERGASLLVCVDCGTSGHGPLEEAARLGMEVIVLDHHQAPEVLPAVLALVNANRQDDLSGLGHLCAAGVVFLTLVGLNRSVRAKIAKWSEVVSGSREDFASKKEFPDLIAALDLVALATVADVVPLTGLNRAFVAQGLKVLRGRERIGLVALADVARLDAEPEAWHLGFLLGPRINAGGRIGDAALGARLLMTENADEAREIAAKLDHLNRERQAVEEAMLAEAEEEAIALAGQNLDGPDDAGRAVLVVTGERWHPGIVGIVAGRIKERFQRPAFAIARAEGAEYATGSGRSIAGVDLGAAVRAALDAGIIIKGGGHAMAAGATLAPDRIVEFSSFLEARLGSAITTSREADALLIDAALTAESLTPDFVIDLARAGPFGQGNPEPVIVLPAHKLVDIRELRGGHLKLTFLSPNGARIEAMAFRAMGRPLGEAIVKARGQAVHIAATAGRDNWGGRLRVSLRVLDLAPIR